LAAVLLACALAALGCASMYKHDQGRSTTTSLQLTTLEEGFVGYRGGNNNGEAARVPPPHHAFVGGVQQLAGWKKEEQELGKLEMRAETRLRKDEASGDGAGPVGGELQGRNATGGEEMDVKDDDGEFLPLETLRAEAAALGYPSVAEWRRALHGHRQPPTLSNAAAAADARPKVAGNQQRQQQQHEVGGVEGDITAVVKWMHTVAAALRSKSRVKEQQLSLSHFEPPQRRENGHQALRKRLQLRFHLRDADEGGMQEYALVPV